MILQNVSTSVRKISCKNPLAFLPQDHGITWLLWAKVFYKNKQKNLKEKPPNFSPTSVCFCKVHQEVLERAEGRLAQDKASFSCHPHFGLIMPYSTCMCTTNHEVTWFLSLEACFAHVFLSSGFAFFFLGKMLTNAALIPLQYNIAHHYYFEDFISREPWQNKSVSMHFFQPYNIRFGDDSWILQSFCFGKTPYSTSVQVVHCETIYPKH